MNQATRNEESGTNHELWYRLEGHEIVQNGGSSQL